MADYDIKLNKEVINEVLDAQMSEHLNAGKFEYNAEREGCRNGWTASFIQWDWQPQFARSASARC